MPAMKASTALSSETPSAALRMVVHREMYERMDSPRLWVHARSTSIVAGRLYVAAKVFMNFWYSSDQVRIDSVGSPFSHALAESAKYMLRH